MTSGSTSPEMPRRDTTDSDLPTGSYRTGREVRIEKDRSIRVLRQTGKESRT